MLLTRKVKSWVNDKIRKDIFRNVLNDVLRTYFFWFCSLLLATPPLTYSTQRPDWGSIQPCSLHLLALGADISIIILITVAASILSHTMHKVISKASIDKDSRDRICKSKLDYVGAYVHCGASDDCVGCPGRGWVHRTPSIRTRLDRCCNNTFILPPRVLGCNNICFTS